MPREIKFTTRDLLAIPFWYLAQTFEKFSIKIGGVWTANMYLKQEIEIGEKIKQWMIVSKGK